MTPNNTHGKHFSDKLKIERFKDYELDEAIKNLCGCKGYAGRGYKLVSRGKVQVPNRRYDSLEKHWAILRKV